MHEMDTKKQALLKALEATYGNITEACKLAEIARRSYYNYINNDPEFKAEVEAAEYDEQYMDMVESKLAKLAEGENPTVLIFLAKTKGKRRGYIERQEIEHDNTVITGITISRAKP